MLLYSLLHRSPCFPLVSFTPSTRNFVDYAVLFSQLDRATGESIFAIELAAHCLHISVSYFNLLENFWDSANASVLVVVRNGKDAAQYSQDVK